MKIIDMHVHMVGNEASGNGCWVRVSAGKIALYAIMLRALGLPTASIYRESFDDIYRDRLLECIRESTVDAVCLLAQEAVYHDDGTIRKEAGNAFVPNDYVLNLARDYEEFLPAVSIHPARPDAMDELDRCLEGGAVMMKCLPNCQNINCNDTNFKPFWNRMAESGLPLLAHTGGEHTLQVVKPEYADPETLRLPLECGVKVVAAHCATMSGIIDMDYFPKLAEMFCEYENLYADTSALNVPLRSHGLRRCLEDENVASRLVHGSDFPVPCSGLWAWMRGLIDSDQAMECGRITSPIERDYQIKVAMGFPPEKFTRINDLLRKTN
jgi:hypothetical protein